MNASNAIPASGIVLSGEPFTENAPPENSRSSALASSWWAAISFALSMTLSHAIAIATPPTGSDREP